MECENRNTEIKKNVPVVYFISDGAGSCKIGVASDIQSRFGTLQVGNANELKILNLQYFDTLDSAYEVEREHHYNLRKYKKRGEWYQENAVIKYLRGQLKEHNDYCVDICPDFDFMQMLKFFLDAYDLKQKYEDKEKFEQELSKITPKWMKKCAVCNKKVWLNRRYKEVL